jgi:hypothetical protein
MSSPHLCRASTFLNDRKSLIQDEVSPGSDDGDGAIDRVISADQHRRLHWRREPWPMAHGEEKQI